MPSRHELPGSLSRAKLLKALTRIGFEISHRGGSGSHCKVTWPHNGKSVTIKKDVRNDVLHYVLKEIEAISGVTWDDVKARL